MATFSVQKKVLLSSALLILAVTTAGCGVWIDFTTYFNRYYNLTDIFDRVEDGMLNNSESPFIIDVPAPNSTVYGDINKVISKASELLQFNNESSYVDNTLLFVGKCYYYQKSYPQALRKFKELVATQPNSDLIPDAKLWIAKTNLYMRNFQEGLELLDEAITESEANGNQELLVEAIITRVKYAKLLEKSGEAIQYAERLLTLDAENTIIAYTHYELGSMYYAQGELEKASESYKNVSNFFPPSKLEANAIVEYAKIKRELGDSKTTIDILTDFVVNDIYREFRDIGYLELGKTYKLQGDYDNAYKTFFTADTALPGSIQLGGIRYEMADMFAMGLKNYDSAGVYFEKAAATSATIEYSARIRTKMNLFKRYKQLSTDFINTSNQAKYALDENLFIQDSIKWALDSVEVEKEVQALVDPFATTIDPEIKDTIAEKIEQPEPGSTETGNEQNPNRGRNREGLDDTPKPKTPADNNAEKILKLRAAIGNKPKRPVIAVDSLIINRVRASLDLGNLFFTELNIPDSAYYYYNLIVSKHPETRLQPNALVGLAAVYETKGEKTNADSIYLMLYTTHKTSPLVNVAAEKLDSPKVDFNFDPGEKQFLRAEELYETKKFKEALREYSSVSETFRESRYAPHSLLAKGIIYEYELSLVDSAAATYDTLVVRYPRSPQAAKINQKLNQWKFEQDRIKKASADSLKAVQDSLDRLKNPVVDSVKTNATETDSMKTDSSAAPQAPLQGNNYFNSVRIREYAFTTQEKARAKKKDYAGVL